MTAKRVKLESPILAEVLAAVIADDAVNAWRNNVGTLPNPAGRPVKFGLAVGSSDVVGIMGIEVRLWNGSEVLIGRMFGLETKAIGGGAATKEQLAWQEVIKRRGGFAAFVRSADEARAALDRCRRLERE
jgi:hypothetical protein